MKHKYTYYFRLFFIFCSFLAFSVGCGKKQYIRECGVNVNMQNPQDVAFEEIDQIVCNDDCVDQFQESNQDKDILIRYNFLVWKKMRERDNRFYLNKNVLNVYIVYKNTENNQWYMESILKEIDKNKLFMSGNQSLVTFASKKTIQRELS